MKSLTPSTLQSYKSATQCYLAFCHSFGIGVASPLSEVILGRVVAFLANKDLSYVMIRVYLSAVRITQITSGNPDPSLSSFPHLDYILRGICRWLPQYKRSKRLPITPDIVQSLFCVWPHPPVTYDKVMLWTACCEQFFGFLHSGEFTCPPAASTIDHVLSVSDVGVDSRSNPLFVSSTCVTPRQTFLL